jgi:hypothetical protein
MTIEAQDNLALVTHRPDLDSRNVIAGTKTVVVPPHQTNRTLDLPAILNAIPLLCGRTTAVQRRELPYLSWVAAIASVVLRAGVNVFALPQKAFLSVSDDSLPHSLVDLDVATFDVSLSPLGRLADEEPHESLLWLQLTGVDLQRIGEGVDRPCLGVVDTILLKLVDGMEREPSGLCEVALRPTLLGSIHAQPVAERTLDAIVRFRVLVQFLAHLVETLTQHLTERLAFLQLGL